MLEALLTSSEFKPFRSVRQVATMDAVVTGGGLFMYDDKVFNFGGSHGVGLTLLAIRRWERENWTRYNFTTVGANHGSGFTQPVVIGNQAYVLGGKYLTANVNRITKVNLDTGTPVTTGAVLPTSQDIIKTALLDNRYIYALLGYSAVFVVYDTVANTVTVKASPSTVTNAHVGELFAHEGKIYYIGGWGNSLNPNIYVYTPSSNTWALYYTMKDTVDGMIHQGGFYEDGIYNYVGWDTPRLKLTARRFDVKRKLFAKAFDLGVSYRNVDSVTGKGDKMYLLGGCNKPYGNADFGKAENLFNQLYEISL